MRGNILILSEDAVFARMLELELAAMHFSVVVNSAPTQRKNDLILVDLDSVSVPQKAGDGARIVGFTRLFDVSGLDASRRCSMILHRPFQMRILREEVALLNVTTQERERPKGEKSNLEVILDGNTLTIDDKQLTLRPKEVAVMSCLLANRGATVPREELSSIIGESSTNKTDVHICYLRRKIATVTERSVIKTVRGRGYKID